MSEISDSIDRVIEASMAARLRELGYRKNARIFYIRDSEHTRIVQVLASRFNVPRFGQFELMLGVYFPDVAQVLEKPPLKVLPRFEDCILWESLSRLAFDITRPKEEILYQINLDLPTDLQALARRIGGEWEEYGHPWLDRVKDPKEAAIELSHRKWFAMAAAIYLAKGLRDKASEQIGLDLAARPGVETWAKEWAERNGLI